MQALLLGALLTLLQLPVLGVSGTVSDSSGSTVPGALVRLEVSGVVVSEAQTGTDGRFAFPAAGRDAGRLVITAPGFAPRIVAVAAGQAAPLTIELEPAPFFDAIQVTSSRGIEPRADPTVTASVLPAAEVTAAASLAVDDLLKFVPGFTLFPSSRVANPTTQTMMLRGLGGSGVSRSLVLADGVPLNDPFGGWVYWDKVPHAAIDRIEVLRGGGSDLYGADAIGGVVQILTLEPSGPTARVLVEGGTLHTGRVSAFAGGRRRGWSVSGGGQWFTTAGYVVVARDDRGAVDGPSGSTHRSAIGSLHYTARDGWRFGARASLFWEDRANGTPLQINDTAARLASAEAQGGFAGGFLTVHAFGATQTYAQTFSDFETEPPRASEEVSLVQRVPTRSGGAAIQWSRRVREATLLVGGEGRVVTGHSLDAQYEHGGLVALTDPGGTTQLGSVFARATMPVTGRLTMVLGAHADAWHSSSRGMMLEQAVGSVSPRVSAAYRVAGGALSLRGSLFGAFRAPTLNELYRTFRVGNDVTLPNESLAPERLTGGEAGVNITRGPASVRVTGFWGVLTDAVTNVTQSTSPALNIRRRENADRIRSMGLEFEGDVRLSSALSVSVTGALMDSRFKGDTILRDFRVPQVAEYSVSGILRYRDPLWTVSGQLRLTGPQFDDDVNTRLMRRATVVDAFAGRTFVRRLLAFVAVENVFDAEYDAGRIPVRIVGLPRAVRAGVQVVVP